MREGGRDLEWNTRASHSLKHYGQESAAMRNGVSGKRQAQGAFYLFSTLPFSITAILHLPPSADKESLTGAGLCPRGVGQVPTLNQTPQGLSHHRFFSLPLPSLIMQQGSNLNMQVNHADQEVPLSPARSFFFFYSEFYFPSSPCSSGKCCGFVM